MKTITNLIYPTFALFAFICFALLPAPKAFGVVPAPDGGYPGGNTAEGASALFSLTGGTHNTAVGYLSLKSDTNGSLNTAIGAGTLLANTGTFNTATGALALLSNATGNYNTADGGVTLLSNTTGGYNTANGAFALFNNTGGSFNSARGVDALKNNTTGTGNTAIGHSAGFNQTTGNNNVYIGGIFGVAGESNACYIANVFGETAAGGLPVLISQGHKLGTTTSSRRFKEAIRPMDRASEALFSLKPVSFRYKKEIDPVGTSQLGLVAEEVETVNPDLVVRDKEGRPYSVRYEQVNAMLLNEFLKEHRKVKKLETTIRAINGRLAEQAAQIQKVSAQLELSKSAPQTVLNNH